MHLLLRDEFRSRVRRHMGLIPGEDVPPPLGPLPVGSPSPAQMTPTNNGINSQIDETVADLNLRSGTFYDQPETLQYPVTATTSVGLQMIPLATAAIDIVRTAWFKDSSGGYWPLTPTSWYDLTRDRPHYFHESASTPRMVLIQGMQIGIFPGSSLAGTLYLSAGCSPQSPRSDADTIPQLSADEVVGLTVVVAREMCAQEPGDQVMRSRLQYLMPRADQWLQLILASIAKRNESYTPGMALRRYIAWSGRRIR